MATWLLRWAINQGKAFPSASTSSWLRIQLSLATFPPDSSCREAVSSVGWAVTVSRVQLLEG